MDARLDPEVNWTAGVQVRGGVQPSGFLLALSNDWRITGASANLAEFTAIGAQGALGRPMTDFFAPDAVHRIRNRVALLRDEDSPERLIDLQLQQDGRSFDISLCLSEGEIMLEAVPGTDPGGIDVAGVVERMLKRIERPMNLSDLGETATRELRGITGFDAIQVYRYADGVPERIASSLRSGLAEFQPAQLRPANLQRPLWVADSAGPTIPVHRRAQEPARGHAVLLAAPGRELCEEIERAQARSAVVLPIGSPEEPWGFLLALHRSPRAPRLARLSAAELFAHVLKLRIEALEPSASR